LRNEDGIRTFGKLRDEYGAKRVNPSYVGLV